MVDFMTEPLQSKQNPMLNHLCPPFDGRPPIIQLEARGCRCREQGILTTMIQAGVATEVRVVKMGQGSMAVDQAADRLKVGRGLIVDFTSPRLLAVLATIHTMQLEKDSYLFFNTRANASLYQESSTTYTISGMS